MGVEPVCFWNYFWPIPAPRGEAQNDGWQWPATPISEHPPGPSLAPTTRDSFVNETPLVAPRAVSLEALAPRAGAWVHLPPDCLPRPAPLYPGSETVMVPPHCTMGGGGWACLASQWVNGNPSSSLMGVQQPQKQVRRTFYCVPWRAWVEHELNTSFASLLFLRPHLLACARMHTGRIPHRCRSPAVSWW